jgi:hypothetical protein
MLRLRRQTKQRRSVRAVPRQRKRHLSTGSLAREKK